MSEPLDIDAIEKRAEAATPGPWDEPYADDDSEIGYTICKMYPEGWPIMYTAVVPHAHRGTDESFDNARFIAHARSDVPLLVAEVRRLREEAPDERSRRLIAIAKRERKWARTMEVERDDRENAYDCERDAHDATKARLADLEAVGDALATTTEVLAKTDVQRAALKRWQELRQETEENGK